MKYVQTAEQAVDVTAWQTNEEFGLSYPEGARDKTLMYCPDSISFKFLKPKKWYLFKRSSRKFPEQFWVEILAYYLGERMGVPVPPAFAAFNQNQQSAALIEWFLEENEGTISGGDFCQQYIPGFERKKGRQHNFETVIQVFKDLEKQYPGSHLDWLNYWGKAFIFDALIGNTDRHQDNWSVIQNTNTLNMRISPVFDNGTSMAHEILGNDLERFSSPQALEKYVLGSKAIHHMKWALNDSKRLGHVEFIKKLVTTFPETRLIMSTCLHKISPMDMENILHRLVNFKIPVKLTTERAEFMLKLLTFRHTKLLHELEP